MSEPIFANLNRATFDTANPAPYADGIKKGLNKETVQKISSDKNEPAWMLQHRLESLQIFNDKPLPSWGADLQHLDLDDIIYYASPGIEGTDNWEEIPDEVRNVYDKLGIPEAERKVLAGVGAQYESDIIYHSLKQQWEELGVIFLDMDVALQEHEELVKQYFMKCVPNTDHKFAALHGAVWSGGTFLYVPKGVHMTEPLQAYFRMNAQNMGQFEHTLIIVEDEADVHYIEGCSAPKYGSQGLHAGLVEIFVKPNTLLYPCSMLVGEGARTDHLAIAFANKDQWQDTGAKIFHLAPNTSSQVISKSISKEGGCSVYRGQLVVSKNAKGSIANIECDALLLDEISRTDTVPDIQINNNDVTIAHEATVGKMSEE